MQFADGCEIDIPTAIQSKLKIVKEKYPVDLFKDANGAERHKKWLEAKEAFKGRDV